MVVDFLERFHVATNEFSRQYYPTISNCLVYLADLANLFAYFSEGEEIYEVAIDSMRKKFKKYFFPIFPIYGIAALLNPTMKLGGPQYWYRPIYNGLALAPEELSTLSDAHVSININALTIYSAYQTALDNARPDIPTPSSSSCQSSKRTTGVRALTAWTEFRGSQGCTTTDCSQLNELEVYLSQGLEEVNSDGSFNLLEWWKDKEKYFPILSRKARDILTIQASTVASESAFSQARLQLSDYRSSMRESLEKSVLFRDWIRSERRNF
ncbi:zinc finger BED domain-containing protein RICESLEEPER 4-like [Nicotiana sylvestris]|uniref:zinc finger BED domain-containing protein RICESLEEPER 4-like n=1 Tax=Nicotiana sylvestris TaxID=4096 RepID=UPI00388C9E12